MSPEEKLEMGRKMVAEAEAEIAAKKRNWPEKIEPGMVFRHSGGGVYVWPDERCENLVCLVAGEKANCGDVFYKNLARACMDSFTYLGHARDRIKIADDAHEPTGAELVGKMCQFSDDGKWWTETMKCMRFDPEDAKSKFQTEDFVSDQTGNLRRWFPFARLAR